MHRTVLSSYGYTILTANNGRKALEILTARMPLIDLVITDMVMPGMSGRELADRIQVLWPGTRVLRTSGYVPGSVLEEEETYLKKPFSSRALLGKVRQVLAMAST
jgi:two-component system cell cycle sensor histidine kinase/response regulator CckA